MTRLPQPGPGRPHHAAYSEPSQGASLLELVVVVLAVFWITGLLFLAEALL